MCMVCELRRGGAVEGGGGGDKSMAWGWERYSNPQPG